MATEAFEDIVETFQFLDDWEQRYSHVIDLGKAMEPLDDAMKTESNKVHGCASQVWLIPRIEPEGDQARLWFQGDSDALIVRGLIAILLALYCGLTLGEALKVDARAELSRLDLESHLSSQRSNGLRAMVSKIESIASAAQRSQDGQSHANP